MNFNELLNFNKPVNSTDRNPLKLVYEVHVFRIMPLRSHDESTVSQP